MNLKNYQYLSESIEKLGFGDKLNDALKTKMALGFSEFEVKAKAKFGQDEMTYALKFGQGKSEVEGEKFYFLNSIKVTFAKQNEQSIEQSFQLYKGRGFDTKEMYNLMEKRPVYKMFRKDGENVGRWVKLDFSSKDENNNAAIRSYYDNTTRLDLSREIGKLNLTFANQQEKEMLLADLRRGDQVSVTIRRDGRNEKAFVGVAPQIGGLILFNSEMKEIKRTSSNNIELVSDAISTKNIQKEKLPETTKQLLENTSETQEGRKRKVS